MDRLCHIQKTLIKNIKQNALYPHVEFVLLDYGSKDGLKEWVNENCEEYLGRGILKYHRLEGPTKFHMSHAKNTAHSLATGEIVCGLDADNFTNKNFAFFINHEANKNIDSIGYAHGLQIGDFGGRIFLSNENFKKLGGYDEEFNGWGYEDLDFRHRAFEAGLTSVKIPLYFLRCIQHSDNMRDINMPISKMESVEINKILFNKKREQVKNS